MGLLWVGELAELLGCSFFDQLLCLPEYIDEELARATRHTWCALSRACHAHSYELAPTLGELESMAGAVEELLSKLLGQGGLLRARTVTLTCVGRGRSASQRIVDLRAGDLVACKQGK